MPKAALSALHYREDEAARKLVESIRWPSGPVCGHCGESVRRYATKRPGRWRCGNPECRKDYTVTTGTVMESSHIGLSKWLSAFYLISSSKKGFQALHLQKALGLTYKSAWFLHHRVMETMRTGGLLPPLGGSGKIVEADETYYGPVEKPRPLKKPRAVPYTKHGRSGPANKRAIVALVERGGNVRSFHVPRADKETVSKIVTENIARESRLFTDESNLYRGAAAHFAEHSTVKHSAFEYARGDVHTNTVEGYFSVFKRGMRGVYQHCKEKHLHRYLAEYEFRHNTRYIGDEERTLVAVKGAEGKRLMYHPNH